MRWPWNWTSYLPTRGGWGDPPEPPTWPGAVSFSTNEVLQECGLTDEEIVRVGPQIAEAQLKCLAMGWIASVFSRCHRYSYKLDIVFNDHRRAHLKVISDEEKPRRLANAILLLAP